MWIIAGMIVALGVGVYVGLGAPGLPGREDRVVPSGTARRIRRRRLDWLRAPDQRRRR